MKRRLIWLAGDICIAALIVLAIYVGNYLLPQKGQKAVSPNMTTVQNQIPVQQDQTTAQKDVSEAESLPKIEGLTGLGELEVSQKTQDEVEVYPTDNLQQTNVVLDTQDWHQKFADKFTDKVVATGWYLRILLIPTRTCRYSCPIISTTVENWIKPTVENMRNMEPGFHM